MQMSNKNTDSKMTKEELIKGINEIRKWYVSENKTTLQPIFSNITLSADHDLNNYVFKPDFLSTSISYPAKKQHLPQGFSNKEKETWESHIINIAESELLKRDNFHLFHLLEGRRIRDKGQVN